MKVAMTDTVSMGYSVFPGFGKDEKIKAQPGLTVKSEANADHGPGTGTSFVLSFEKGATLDLSDRLAERLIDIGHAEVAKRRKKHRVPLCLRKKGNPK